MTLTNSKSSANSLTLAENFLLRCLRDGLAHSLDRSGGGERWVKPYPEVTGYLVSYFAEHKRRDQEKLAQSTEKLLSLQDESGGFPSFYDQANMYTFDTAQIMHGFLAWFKITQDRRFIESARKAGDFLCFMQLSSGIMFPIYDTQNNVRVVYKNRPDGSDWGSNFSYIQVKNAEGLKLLSGITKNERYLEAANKLTKISLGRVEYRYTHPLAYYLEGMMAMDRKDLVKRILKQKILRRISQNGFIPYFPGAKYAYVSGSVQLGILLWKSGYKSQAKKILEWARTVQSYDDSGGLFQYAKESGEPDGKIHREINSWGTKYYAQLIRLLS